MIGLLFGLIVAFALLLGGVWVAIALGTGGLLSLFPLLGFQGTMSLAGRQIWNNSTSFILVAVPLFIFMGAILAESGFSDRLYARMSVLLHGLPGGLLQTNIAACTIMSACTGSSVACAATVATQAYPEQSRRGYSASMVLGSLAAGGTLGPLIPPSIMFIIYGAITDQSVGQLFLAGVIPGLVMAVLFMVYIGVRCTLQPKLAPRDNKLASLKERTKALGGLWQIGLLILVVLGGLYAGVGTPTEVAALGATLALIFALTARSLSFRVLKNSLLNAVTVNCMVLFIVIGAKILAVSLAYYHVPPTLEAWVSAAGLSPPVLLLAVIVMYVILGCFFDSISMVMITLPFVYPLMFAQGFDPIWFGVVIVVLVEMGLLTPPLGMNLFVLQGISKQPIGLVIRGSMPFVGLQAAMLGLLYFAPALATWLPSRMLQ